MSEILYTILVFIVGLVLGTLFFGGLWLTVRKAVVSKNPTFWFVGSYFFRISITLIGFYYVSLGSWKRLLVCMLGFVLTRYIIVRVTNPNQKKPIEKELCHEA